MQRASSPTSSSSSAERAAHWRPAGALGPSEAAPEQRKGRPHTCRWPASASQEGGEELQAEAEAEEASSPTGRAKSKSKSNSNTTSSDSSSGSLAAKQSDQRRASVSRQQLRHSSSSSINYLSSLVNKSTNILIDTLKQQYSSLSTQLQTPSSPLQLGRSHHRWASLGGGLTGAQLAQEASSAQPEATREPQACEEGQSTEGRAVLPQPRATPTQHQADQAASGEMASSRAGAHQSNGEQEGKPNDECTPGHSNGHSPARHKLVQRAKTGASFFGGAGGPSAHEDCGNGGHAHPRVGHAPREDGVQGELEERARQMEQLRWKLQQKPSHKHKRASSIRSALRHAHLGPLVRPLAGKRAAAAERAREAAASVAAGLLTGGACSSAAATVCPAVAGASLTGGGGGGGGSGGSAGKLGAKGRKPSELFEPPITRRTVERSRRRGAMQSDPAGRQLSVDTIGLRQLTDEYLANAGVKTGPNLSDAHHFVALDQPAGQSGGGVSSRCQGVGVSAAVAVPGGSSTVAAVATAAQLGGSSPATQQAQCALEAHLHRATRQAQQQRQRQLAASRSVDPPAATPTCHGGDSAARAAAGGSHGLLLACYGGDSAGDATADSQGGPSGAVARRDAAGRQQQWAAQAGGVPSSGSSDSITVLPGALPWQSDVSIQCELLKPAPQDEPFETTGDILAAITRPFPPRGPHVPTSGASFESWTSWQHHGGAHAGGHQHHAGHQLSATLRRGLSAITAHHSAGPASSSAAGSGASSSQAQQWHWQQTPPGSSSNSCSWATSQATGQQQQHHHHLTPGSVALNVVGSLKKSLSNTFEVGKSAAPSLQLLHSQDSLPAYATLHNQPDDERRPSECGRTLAVASASTGSAAGGAKAKPPHLRRRSSAGNEAALLAAGPSANQLQVAGGEWAAVSSSSGATSGSGSGILGNLASRLSRQSSKKLAVGKRGLQRALSFDCRGYKRLELTTGGEQLQLEKLQTGSGASALQAAELAARSTNLRRCAHMLQSSGNLATQTVASSAAASQQAATGNQNNQPAGQLTRPYLPQSASQVDFQLPLLPYDKMQEAIVSQRLLVAPNTPKTSSSTGSQPHEPGRCAAPQEPQTDIDALICAPTSDHDDLLSGSSKELARSAQQQTTQATGSRSLAGVSAAQVERKASQTSTGEPSERAEDWPRDERCSLVFEVPSK